MQNETYNPTPEIASDPLVSAVAAYRAGLAEFEKRFWNDDPGAIGGNPVVVQETYGAPLEVLKSWNAPAVTRAGALAGLRQALEEEGNVGGEDLTHAMLRAAIGYLEQEARPRPARRQRAGAEIQAWADRLIEMRNRLSLVAFALLADQTDDHRLIEDQKSAIQELVWQTVNEIKELEKALEAAR